MMKKIMLLIFILLPGLVFALDIDYYNYDYVIENYDIEVVVNENNTYNITEKVDFRFKYIKDNIYRRIPLKNKFVRLDGLAVDDKVQIIDIDVNENFTTTISNGEYVVKVANSLYDEKKSYVFKYTYNALEDEFNGYDEFNFNLIGPDWDTIIDGVTFKIIFPDNFDKDKIQFLRGSDEIFTDQDINYKVEGKTIVGSSKVIFKPNDFLNINLKLPDNYFKNAHYVIDKKIIFMIVVPVISLIIVFIIWYIYGKDDKEQTKKTFNFTDAYNALEVEFLYKGKASKKGIIALLLELAHKGVIKIEYISKDDSLVRRDDYKITINDYKNCDVNEKILVKELLKRRKEHTLEKRKDNEVMLSDLENKYYEIVDKVLGNINNTKNHRKIFTVTTTKTLISIVIMLISLCLVVGIPTLRFASVGALLISVILVLFYIPLFYLLYMMKDMKSTLRVFLTAYLTIHLLVMFSLTPLFEAIIYDKYYMIGFIVGLICVVGMVICIIYMPKRTKYGVQSLAQINGFRESLIKISDEELDTQLKKNKNYFYDILVYLYILDIGNEVFMKFKEKVNKYPKWFIVSKDFDYDYMIEHINKMCDDFDEVISSIG